MLSSLVAMVVAFRNFAGSVSGSPLVAAGGVARASAAEGHDPATHPGGAARRPALRLTRVRGPQLLQFSSITGAVYRLFAVALAGEAIAALANPALLSAVRGARGLTHAAGPRGRPER